MKTSKQIEGFLDFLREAETDYNIAVRQERRAAKDNREQLQLVMDWLEENGKVIFGLEKLLGNVRKAEKATEGRFYTQRTDVLVEIGKEIRV